MMERRALSAVDLVAERLAAGPAERIKPSPGLTICYMIVFVVVLACLEILLYTCPILRLSVRCTRPCTVLVYDADACKFQI